MGVNKAILVGNVGRDPELRQAGSSTVCDFSLATTDRRFKDENGNPRTEWHNITAWNKLAEIISEYVAKGTMLYIEGRIQTEKWEDKDGNKRYTTKVVADQMEILSKKESASSAPNTNDDDPGY